MDENEVKDEEKQGKEEKTSWLAIGMCLGLSVGMLFGLALFYNLALGMSIGTGIGTAAGLIIDSARDKNDQNGA